MPNVSEMYDLLVQMGVIGGAITFLIIMYHAIIYVANISKSIWNNQVEKFLRKEKYKVNKDLYICLRDPIYFFTILSFRSLNFFLYGIAAAIFSIAIINADKIDVLPKAVLKGLLYFYLAMAQIAMLRLWFLLAYVKMMRRKVIIGLKPRLK